MQRSLSSIGKGLRSSWLRKHRVRYLPMWLNADGETPGFAAAFLKLRSFATVWAELRALLVYSEIVLVHAGTLSRLQVYDASESPATLHLGFPGETCGYTPFKAATLGV